MEEQEYGDFEQEGENAAGVMPVRVRMPRKGEVIGIVKQRLGGNRMEVQCVDGKTRNCRVPGRFKRSMWLKEGNAVIVVPWEFDDTKGDIIFHYNSSAVNQLRRKGMLDNLSKGFY